MILGCIFQARGAFTSLRSSRLAWENRTEAQNQNLQTIIPPVLRPVPSNMAIPNAALQKVRWRLAINPVTTDSFCQLLQEVETQAVLSQQKITQTQAELGAKRRDARLNQLTSNELKSLSKDTKVYEGVGKM